MWSGAAPGLLLQQIKVKGLLYSKKAIWGYFVEVHMADRLIIRTEMATYDDTFNVWDFPGAWIIAGAALD